MVDGAVLVDGAIAINHVVGGFSPANAVVQTQHPLMAEKSVKGPAWRPIVANSNHVPVSIKLKPIQLSINFS